MWKPSIVFVFIAFVLNFNCFGVYAIVCPENVCANSQCDEVNESICSGEDKVIKKGGFCGCCDTCFTLVGRLFQLIISLSIFEKIHFLNTNMFRIKLRVNYPLK